jgi:hypothetical protein
MPIGDYTCSGTRPAHGRARGVLGLSHITGEICASEELDEPEVEKEHRQGNEARCHMRWMGLVRERETK